MNQSHDRTFPPWWQIRPYCISLHSDELWSHQGSLSRILFSIHTILHKKKDEAHFPLMVQHQSVLLISLIKTIKSQNHHITFEGRRVLGLKVRIFRFFYSYLDKTLLVVSGWWWVFRAKSLGWGEGILFFQIWTPLRFFFSARLHSETSLNFTLKWVNIWLISSYTFWTGVRVAKEMFIMCVCHLCFRIFTNCSLI